MDIKNFENHIVDLRNPNSISLATKSLTPPLNRSQGTDEKESPLVKSVYKNKGKNEQRNRGGLGHSNSRYY